MINLNTIGSLLKVLDTSTSTQNLKTLLKLVSVDVIKTLENGKYLLEVDNKQLQAQSQKQLQVGERYFAKYQEHKTQLPLLSHLVKLPKLQKDLLPLLQTSMQYETKDLKTLLLSKEPLQNFKEQLLHEMANAQTKEQFQAFSSLLLSLNQHVWTIPLHFHNYFGFLQIKKRYNKKTKQQFLSFYAIFESLGPISGVISMQNIKINVAYDEIKTYLDSALESISYPVTISVEEIIVPLFEQKQNNSILDITT